MSFPGNSNSARPVGAGVKFFASLFFLVFLGMGLVFAWLVAREALAGLKTWTWARTPCEIIRSDVRDTDVRGRKSDDFYFDVEYRYDFKGQNHSSSRHKLKPTSSSDYSTVGLLTEAYRPGSHSICYVNPSAPNEAVLERGSLLFPLLVLFPMIFVAIGAGGIYGTWRQTSPSQTKTRPISDLSTKAVGRTFAIVFFGAFAVIGGVVFYFISIRPLSGVFNARKWPAVPCTVISSNVRSHRGDKGSTYSINILYSYVIDDHTYKANSYDFIGGSSSGYSRKRAIVARYPPGSTSTCYVNPRDPNQAVLKRGFTPLMWIGLLPLLFCLVGLVGLTSTLRKKRQEASGANRSIPTSALRNLSGAPAQDSSFVEERSTMALKRGTSPWVRFVVIVIFALFWNGIISVFLTQVVKGWRSNHFEWFIALFLIPFVLVGLGLLVAIGYFFLAWFNPRPSLSVTPGTPRLGDSLRVDWEISGRVESLRSLRVRLEGIEEVTYNNGNKTATDRSVFARIDIASITLPQDMRSGSGGVTVPAGLMHSFASQHNKIAWSIRVDGSIAMWPDLNEEFPLTVLPGRPNAREGL